MTNNRKIICKQQEILKSLLFFIWEQKYLAQAPKASCYPSPQTLREREIYIINETWMIKLQEMFWVMVKCLVLWNVWQINLSFDNYKASSYVYGRKLKKNIFYYFSTKIKFSDKNFISLIIIYKIGKQYIFVALVSLLVKCTWNK